MSTARVLVFALVALAAARPAAAGTGDVLVLLGERHDRKAHEQFFEEVHAIADSLTFRFANDTDVALFENGTRSFAAAVILARDLNGSATPQRLIEFVDDGGGIFLATDELASPAVRGLAHNLGVDLAEPGARVEDRVTHAVGKAKGRELGPETLATSNAREVVRAMPQRGQAALLYRGTGLRASPDAKGRISVVVSAEETAQLVRGDGQTLAGASDAIGLVAIAGWPSGPGRAVVVGSLDALSDALFPPISVVRRDNEDGELVSPSNRIVFRTLAAWGLGASGTLRVASFEVLDEAADGSTSPVPDPTALRAGERVKVVLALEERRLVTHRPKPGVPGSVPTGPTWNPYLSQGVRLDVEGPETSSTLFRLELEEQGLPTGRFYARAAVPETPGEYAWIVHHNREGLTPIEKRYRFSVLPPHETHAEL